MFEYNTVEYNTIQSNTIQSTIQSNTIEYNTIEYNSVQPWGIGGVRRDARSPSVAGELHQLDGVELGEIERPAKNRFVQTDEQLTVDVVLDELFRVTLEVQRLKTVAQLVDREVRHVQRNLSRVLPPSPPPVGDALQPSGRGRRLSRVPFRVRFLCRRPGTRPPG